MNHASLKRKRANTKVDIDYPLKRVFKKQSFRPLQREIINAALEGEDIFVQAATSFGKSLCFQLPAWCSKGVTVVISPLLALVQNQVNAANNLGIVTRSITSNTPFTQRKEIEADLQCGHPHIRLLYATPELCATEKFRGILRRLHTQGQLIRIAIDEAHCISEWGHDFRPAYKDLKWLKANLQCPSVPIMALTATATPKVRQDIYKYLNLKQESTLFFSTSTARPNIHYEVQYFSESNPRDSSGDDIYPYLLAYLTQIHERRQLLLSHLQSQTPPSPPPLPISGIIYTTTRAHTESLAAKLRDNSINVTAYHAGLDPPLRLKIQNQFIRSSTTPLDPQTSNQSDPTDISSSFTLITATSAFGMGIDIPTIRLVIHYGLPRNLESFIQESGRAGRDGKAAQSLVLYTREERDRTIYRVKMDVAREANKKSRNVGNGISGTQPAVQAEHRMKTLEKVIEYIENTVVCRHSLISKYFGQPSSVVAQSSINATPVTGTAPPASALHTNHRGNSTAGAPPQSNVNPNTNVSVKMIGPASSKSIISPTTCDYACDICKEGSSSVRRRRDRGLASDEEASQFTQMDRGRNEEWE